MNPSASPLWSQYPQRTVSRGATLGAGEIGSEQDGQANDPRASTWTPLATSRRSSPTAEPPVRPSLTSGSPRSPWSGASSKPMFSSVGSALTPARMEEES